MLRGNGGRKGPVARERCGEERSSGVIEIMITPFEAEMLRVVLEAMRDCGDDEDFDVHPLRPNRQGVPLRVVERQDS